VLVPRLGCFSERIVMPQRANAVRKTWVCSVKESVRASVVATTVSDAQQGWASRTE